jgi:hypothetical protein
MDTTSWNENTGEPRVWKLTRAVRGRAGGKGPSSWYLACCLSYYDLNEPLPEHSSLTRIRTRYGLDVFRRFLAKIVEQCQQEKLVWGKELYFDSTQVNANADLDSLTPRFVVEAREAIQEHLSTLFAFNPVPLEKPDASSSEVALSEHLQEASFCAEPTPLPIVLSEPQHEDLATENAARHDWIAQEGQQRREVHGSYVRTADFRISTTDPDATPMRLKGGGTHLGYHTHYVVDGGKRRIILAVLVTPGEVMDNHPMLDLLWHTCFRWHLRPNQVTADSLYGRERTSKPSKRLAYGPTSPSLSEDITTWAIMARHNLPMMPARTCIIVPKIRCCVRPSAWKGSKRCSTALTRQPAESVQ